MSEVDEITTLIHAYARLVDRGDVEALVALFDHATWRSTPGGSVRRGAAEIRPVYENLLASEDAHRTKHLITNVSVDVGPGATTASAHCYWTVLRGRPDGPIDITLSGQYTDTFEKADGEWRFTDRLITVDLTGRP